MVFSSLTFLYFYLPAVMIIYFICPNKFKNLFILISGLFFYAWGEPIYVLIMLLSTLIDYTAGRLIHHFDSDNKKRTLFLVISVCMNIGLLAIFKYSSFFIDNINSFFGADIYNPNLPLPIGISFYTFQSMSYTIDLYRRNIKVQRNFINFAAYVTLFPQIVAGPIVRYEDVQNELDSRIINVNKASEGIAYFVKGLSKKVLIANNIGLVWTQVKASNFSEISMATAWIGILAFTFQIYFDFSGYSDMAVGLGKMMGFNFPENFNYPYISKSISEFWRRWHITLGSWFKSYVYFPLGGSKKGLPKTLINLLIVWMLTGLWHGASWNFILWGLYFGILIIIEKLGFGKVLEKLPAVISTLYTFIMVVFGWVLFETESLADCAMYFKAMLGGTGVYLDSNAKYLLFSNLLIFAVCILGSTQIFKKLYEKAVLKFQTLIVYIQPLAELGMMALCTAFLVNATYNPFLYFRF